MKKVLNFENILLFFLIIQPFFDLIYTYGSVSTLIRIVIIIALFIATIIKYKDKNAVYILLMYLASIIIYFLVHNQNCLIFNSLVPGNFGYSTFEEMLYFIKMFTPILLIYVVYKNILINDKLNNTYKIVVGIIAGSIIITNLLGISLSMYDNNTIKANIIMWFFGAIEKYKYTELAGRGFFYFGNHIVAILLIMLPLIISFFIKNKSKLNLIMVMAILLAMLILGNKISVFGTYLVIIACFILYFIFSKFKKEYKIEKKIYIPLFIIILVYTIFIYFSPAYSRIITLEGTMSQYRWASESIKQQKIDYIRDNYKIKKIKPYFIEKSYPYKYDPDFWYEIVQKGETIGIDYRYLETEMMNRIILINNNPNDKYFGIGYSRQMNIFNVEKDYINQYYSLGIIGTILLLGPYIVIFLFSIYKIIAIKKLFNFENTMILFSIFLLLLAAYFSGNLFNSLSVMIPFAYICGIMLKRIENKS